LSIISDKLQKGDDNMENRGGASADWLLNKEVKTISFREIKGRKDSPTIIEIKEAIEELEFVRKYFDIVDVPELIEYAIYREKAAITRLSYLIRKVKFETACSPKI
jgi:hypothetical protein